MPHLNHTYGLVPPVPAIASGQYAYREGSLFAGFDREAIPGADARFFDDLGQLSTMPAVERVFLGRPRSLSVAQGTHSLGRSLFVPNAHERALLASGQVIPDDLEPIIFPQGSPGGAEGSKPFPLLEDPAVQVVCVNTAYPNAAIRNWLDRAIEPNPNRGRVGVIGFGAIGYHMVQAMVTNSSTLASVGQTSPITRVNVMEDPASNFKGRLLEVFHTHNRAEIPVEVYGQDQVAQFLKESELVFCIFSLGVPPLTHRDIRQGDVRMMQFSPNYQLLQQFVREAESSGFSGTLVVVSDPPEHLATALVRDASSRVHHQTSTRKGVLGNHQIVAEAGLTNFARGIHFTNDEEFLSLCLNFGLDPSSVHRDLIQHGAAFGPHGRGGVIANDTRPARFHPVLTDYLSRRVATANYDVRKGGHLPADAPAHNLALAAMDMLRGEPLPISVLVGNVVTGVRARFHAQVGGFEVTPFPEADRALRARVVDAAHLIRSTFEIASGVVPVEYLIPCRSSAFWANGAITGEALPTRLVPDCSGRDIPGFKAAVVSRHHFSRVQGEFYLPSGDPLMEALVRDLMQGYLRDTKWDLHLRSDDQEKLPPRDKEAIRSLRPIQFQSTGAQVGCLRVDYDPVSLKQGKLRLPLYRQENSLFLQVDVAIDDPYNVSLIQVLRDKGALLLGFTPRTHTDAPRLHLGFIGEDVRVDGEFPAVPLSSSMEGFPGAQKVFGNWIQVMRNVRARVGEERCALTYREVAIQRGKAMIERDELLKTLLVKQGLYDEVPRQVLYEHVLDVSDVARSLARVLKQTDKVDEMRLQRLVALHDLGKAIYLLLNHYRNAVRLQARHRDADTGVSPVAEPDLGPENTHWRYGRYLEALKRGDTIEMPDFLTPYAHYLDLNANTIVRDVDIAKDLVQTTSALEAEPQLKADLIRFFESDGLFEMCEDPAILLIELADNLSDFGRVSRPEDIARYLGLKEQYVLARYGSDADARASIRQKFANLKRHVHALLTRS